MRQWTTTFVLTLTVVATACVASQDQEQDQDEDARREAVLLLGELKDEQACQTLLPALVDPSQDIRQRAARALYQCDRSTITNETSAGALFRESIELGNPAAAAILLLGYFPDDKTTTALNGITEKSVPVKLESWMIPVPATLAAAVSLTRLQQSESKVRVLKSIARDSLDEQVFLLNVLSDIDEKDILRSLAGFLSDQREIRYGVPSGATPRRRLCDMALDKFVKRLDLKIDFPLAPSGRYSDAQLKKVKTAIFEAIGST